MAPAALEILLVEDNEGDVEMVQQALLNEETACNLCVVNDGLEAMDFLLKQGKFIGAPTPHIVLMDLNMPRMNGKEFLDVVKDDVNFKAIPVVMLTSSSSPADIRECYKRHASSYIVKPFDGKEFAEAVQQVVKFWRNVGSLPDIEIPKT